MTTAISPSDAARNAAVDAVTALANGGTIRIYSGTKPTNGQTAVGAQVLLAEVGPLPSPAYDAAVAGVANLDADPDLTDAAANATGTATWYRVVGSGGTAVWDGTCGETGSGEGLILSDTDVVTGGAVTIESGTFTANQ